VLILGCEEILDFFLGCAISGLGVVRVGECSCGLGEEGLGG